MLLLICEGIQSYVGWFVQEKAVVFTMCFTHFVLGLPSAYQQKKIEELNVTLRREQFGSLADRDRMLKVNNLVMYC